MRVLAATGVEAENIFRDVLAAAVDDGEPPAAEGEPQLPGQRPHPVQGVFFQLRGGMGKPYLGPIGAGAVAFELAAAFGGVGDNVAGADDLLRGQAQGAGPG
jgi:hypothetical protein